MYNLFFFQTKNAGDRQMDCENINDWFGDGS